MTLFNFLSSQLILSERGWFRNKASVLHEGEGNIRTIKWRSSLIAWANDAVSQNIRKAWLIVFRPVLIMMAKPMKTLELYYPMIQVLITFIVVCLFISGSQNVWHEFSASNNSHQKRARKVCTNIYLATTIFILPLSTQE